MLLLTSVAGCGVDRPATGDDPGIGPIWDRTFISTSIIENGEPRQLVGNVPVRLGFGNGRLTAAAGCNQLTGSVDVDTRTIMVSDLITTEMACDQAQLDQDKWLSRFLTRELMARIDGDELTLRTGETEMRLTDARSVSPDRPLRETRWLVESVIEQEVVSSAQGRPDSHLPDAYLVFQTGDRVVGFTGCNNLHGRAVVQGKKIRLAALAITRKACPGEPYQVEKAVIAVLSGEVAFRIENDLLTLTGADGRGLQLRATP